jgi:lysylphosphatidylglycerol synthetase-like protein (DUF2156 family)
MESAAHRGEGGAGGDAAPAQRIVEAAVRRFGRTAFAFDVLQCRERYAFFVSRAVSGALVPYRAVGGADVVIGEPLAPEDALAPLTAEFLADRRAARRRVVGFLASEAFAHAAVAAGAAAAQLTAEPELDPATWEPRGGSAKKLRAYVRRLRREGIDAVTLPTGLAAVPADFRAAVDALVAEWLRAGAASAAHLLEVDPWRRPEEKRYFAVFDPKRSDRLWALLIAHPVYALGGWHLCHLVRHPEAPKGATELAVMRALEVFGDEGVRYATFGAFGDPQPGPFLNVGRLRAAVYARAYRLASITGGYARALEFYRKVQPGPWRPRYLVFTPRRALARGFYTVTRVTHVIGRSSPG